MQHTNNQSKNLHFLKVVSSSESVIPSQTRGFLGIQLVSINDKMAVSLATRGENHYEHTQMSVIEQLNHPIVHTLRISFYIIGPYGTIKSLLNFKSHLAPAGLN